MAFFPLRSRSSIFIFRRSKKEKYIHALTHRHRHTAHQIIEEEKKCKRQKPIGIWSWLSKQTVRCYNGENLVNKTRE